MRKIQRRKSLILSLEFPSFNPTLKRSQDDMNDDTSSYWQRDSDAVFNSKIAELLSLGGLLTLHERSLAGKGQQ